MKKILKVIGYAFKCGFAILAAYFIWIRRYYKKRDQIPLEERYRRVRKLVKRVIFSMGIKDYELEGAEFVVPKEPTLYLCNHQSAIDPLCLICLSEKPISFIAKKETRDYPFAGKVIAILDGLFLDRDDPFQAVQLFREAVKNMKEKGVSYAIFPEGTRNKTPFEKTLGELKPGAFKIAYKAQCPIVAYAQFGSWRPFHEQSFSGHYLFQMHFLEPLSYEDYKDAKTNELAERFRVAMSPIIGSLAKHDIEYREKKLYKGRRKKWWKVSPLKELTQ